MAVSKVEVVVLGLLAEEPLYGYELLERFRARSMGFWVEVGKASVYQVLRRLEREGLHRRTRARGRRRTRSARVSHLEIGARSSHGRLGRAVRVARAV